ncbi:hypothetical protein Tco_1515957 [Tanacetum coccineum]
MEEINETLCNKVLELSVSTTNTFIKEALPKMVNEFFKQDSESSQAVNMVLNVHPTTSASTATTTIAKFEKSSASAGSCRDDAFRKRDHDEHQGNDGPPEGEKRVQRQRTSKGSKSASGSSSKQPIQKSKTSTLEQDETPDVIEEFQNVDKRVPTIFDHERKEATLRDMMRNQFKDAAEYAYHLEQSKNYMENRIVWEIRQEDIRRSKPYALVFYGPQRNLNEPLMSHPDNGGNSGMQHNDQS